MEQTIDRQLKRGELVAMIRAMSVGDIIRFPLSKYDTVRNAAQTRTIVERAEGHRWSVRADIAAKQAVVIKTS